MQHHPAAGSSTFGAGLVGALLGGATWLDPPLSWLACVFFLLGAAIIRSSRPVAGGAVVAGTVVGHVVQPVGRARRGPLLSERIRYRARGIDDVWREHEVVHALTSSRPAPVGATRALSYHPAAPADGRVLDRRLRFVGWWFVMLGLWALVVFGLGRSIIGLGWTLVSAAAGLGWALAAPVHPPPGPPPDASWRPPAPSWPQAGDPTAVAGLVPGVRRHLHRRNLLTAGGSFAVSTIALAVLRAF